MKRGLLILAVALLAGLAGFVLTRQQSCRMSATDSSGMDAGTRLPELGWVRREFQLSDDQFAKVSALHLAYRPTCTELCARIEASHAKLDALVTGSTQVSPELKAALQNHAAIHAECQAAMLDHLYRTAGCMSPDQAQRYLGTMLPQVTELPMEPASTRH